MTIQQYLDRLTVECCRCRHRWLRRMAAEPRWCPNCHSPFWNKPRVRAPGGGRKPHADKAPAATNKAARTARGNHAGTRRAGSQSGGSGTGALHARGVRTAAKGTKGKAA